MRTVLVKLAILLLVVFLLASNWNPGPAVSAAPIGNAAPPPTVGQGRGQAAGPELEAADVVRLFWHEAVGGPDVLAGKKSVRPAEIGLSDVNAEDPKLIAQGFLRAYGPQLQTAQAGVEWRPSRTEEDAPSTTHVFPDQIYRGIPVFASQVAVHIKNGEITAANGAYAPSIGVSIKPVLTSQSAFKAVSASLGLTNPVQTSAEMVIFNPALLDSTASANHLAYKLVVIDQGMLASQTVLIDAHSGKILLSYSNLQESKYREVYDHKGASSGTPSICRTEYNRYSPSAECLAAFFFTGDTYEYYNDTFGRDSYDGHGATMKAFVRDGSQANNALWNGNSTHFGPGYAVKDVMAHEWTHAVTQFTAGLIYQGQSGALNEGFSDVFGAMIDRDWLMGEDLPRGAIRSLSNPNAFGQPGKVSDSQYYCGTADNGGVHINSGVLNHAAQLMADGGTYNGSTVTGIGRRPTAAIFYRALTRYLTNHASFLAAYLALVSSASDLYGNTSTNYEATLAAVQATEMNRPICRAASSAADSYEDDGWYPQASSITVNGSSQRHNFHNGFDNDYVRFQAATGNLYTIETFNLGSRSDTYLYLYDTDGTTVIAEDDDGGGGRASRLYWTPSSSGTYYVDVAPHDGFSVGSDTSYELRVTSVPASGGADAYESDNTMSIAKDFTPNGAPQEHNFSHAADYDWVKFGVGPLQFYTIRTSALGTRADTVITLYDSDGRQITENDDYDGLSSYFRFFSGFSIGTYYLRVRQYNAFTYGANTNYRLSITASVLPLDSFEPDDAPGQAALIATDGVPQTHYFGRAGDVDWLRFSARAGLRYVIETLNADSVVDTAVQLYGPDGTALLAVNDDDGQGLASRLVFTPRAAGTYYVRVSPADGGAPGVGGGYEVRVTGSDCGTGDSFEPDDTFAQASTLSATVQTRNFYCSGDVDWAKFTASAGTNYTIDTLNLGADSDTILDLYGTDGTTLLASNDDDGGLASRINWTAASNGAYYVKVHNYSSSVSGPGTEYGLRLTSASCGTGDGYEPDGSSTTAKEIAVNGGAQSHSFSCPGDLDWVKFLAVAGLDYVVQTENLSSGNDTVVGLYDADGSTLLVEDDDGGGRRASRIVWTAPLSGTYYVKARSYSSTASGASLTYDLRVTSSGSSAAADTYENDNAAASAKPITTTAQTHNFHLAGDVDWAKFDATAGTSYVVETVNLASRTDTVLRLYGPDGTSLLAEDDDSGGGVASRIGWTAPTSNTYYLWVRDYYYTTTYGANTDYDLRVSILGAGGSDSYEGDNTATLASTITVDGSPQIHNFHAAGDVDWIRFGATASAVYNIQTANLGLESDTVL